MDIFDDIWAKLVGDYTPDTLGLVEYLRHEWIKANCKTEVFDCFLDRDLMHFG